MKNGIDFVYEYSDLNLFQTRVKVLTGRYRGVILEFGGSGLAQHGDKNTFTFDYTLYEIPEHLACYQLRGTKEFEAFLAYLLVDVIDARNNDPKELSKLHEAASAKGKTTSNIKIDNKFYFTSFKKQPIAQGLRDF
jgi:hypothetical protein